jgi:hypothetical protein
MKGLGDSKCWNVGGHGFKALSVVGVWESCQTLSNTTNAAANLGTFHALNSSYFAVFLLLPRPAWVSAGSEMNPAA